MKFWIAAIFVIAFISANNEDQRDCHLRGGVLGWLHCLDDQGNRVP